MATALFRRLGLRPSAVYDAGLGSLPTADIDNHAPSRAAPAATQQAGANNQQHGTQSGADHQPLPAISKRHSMDMLTLQMLADAASRQGNHGDMAGNGTRALGSRRSVDGDMVRMRAHAPAVSKRRSVDGALMQQMLTASHSSKRHSTVGSATQPLPNHGQDSLQALYCLLPPKSLLPTRRTSGAGSKTKHGCGHITFENGTGSGSNGCPACHGTFCNECWAASRQGYCANCYYGFPFCLTTNCYRRVIPSNPKCSQCNSRACSVCCSEPSCYRALGFSRHGVCSRCFGKIATCFECGRHCSRTTLLGSKHSATHLAFFCKQCGIKVCLSCAVAVCPICSRVATTTANGSLKESCACPSGAVRMCKPCHSRRA